jgi:eukaryotic-like serine/threonine-protein kinase
VNAERWQQVERLYHVARESGAEERAAFLAEACAGDEELRHEVESLLAYEDQADDFIESPALEDAAKIMAEEQGATLVAGQTINHYKIISPLGAGGMGEVYLAEDTRLERRVALKFLPAHFTQDKRYLRRFEQEARAVAAMSHPNVCMIHEVVKSGEGRHCIVMEYVEGVTLREHTAERRMKVGEVLDAAIQVASALAAAHAAGIVHRDIKLENIMLRPDGYVKILDFGLAKLTEREAASPNAEARKMSLVNTSPGVVMGTANYMSPEQARGLPVDARTDVWSLGVVVYEMVTGQQPFDGATPTDVIISIAGREPEPLARCAPGVPVQLEQIVKRALAKDREERYQTAEDLLIDLKSLRHELEIEIKLTRYKQPRASSRSAATMSNRQVITSRFFPLRLTRSRILILTAGLLIIAGLVSALFFSQSSTLAPQTEIKSIAVLPLDNLSGDPAQDYFADGLTDALIGDLAKIGELRVISRTSSMHFKGTKKSLPEIAGELKVDAVVEGTVQRSGEHVRIRVQLIHAATDRHLWAETYERDMQDVLGLQSEIARAIAREVQIKTTPAEQAHLTARRPVHPRALDDYLQGRYLLWNKPTEENLGKAIEYLQSAIREDSTYAPAFAGLADCYNRLGSVAHGALSPMEARRRAEEAAVKALELDGGLAEAHTALAYVKHYNWDWAAAEQGFKRAIELNPNYAHAHNFYAGYLMSRGRAEESLAASNRARELDPFSLSISTQRGFLLANARRYDEAIEQLRRVVAMDPNHYNAYWFLGHIYAFNGQLDEAVAASEKAVSLLSERAPGALGMLGLVYGIAGRKGEAANVLNELLELNKRRYVPPTALAWVYIGLGNRDQAFVWLEKAYQERSNYLVYFKVNPIADSLRSDPRFGDLVRRVGLPY